MRILVQRVSQARVLVDDEVVIDAREGDFGSGDDFFGFGSAEIEATVELSAGDTTSLVVEYDNRDAVLLAGMKLGVVASVERDLLGEAVDAVAVSLQYDLVALERMGAAAVAAGGVHDVGDRQAVEQQPFLVDVDLVLLLVAADCRYLGDAGHRFEVVAEVPVLIRAQVGQAVGARPVDERVLVLPRSHLLETQQDLQNFINRRIGRVEHCRYDSSEASCLATCQACRFRAYRSAHCVRYRGSGYYLPCNLQDNHWFLAL